MNEMKLRKRKRNRVVYEITKILMFNGEMEINELIKELNSLNLKYRLSPNKIAQYLRNQPDIHRTNNFRNSNRIAVYSWKPSNHDQESV